MNNLSCKHAKDTNLIIFIEYKIFFVSASFVRSGFCVDEEEARIAIENCIKYSIFRFILAFKRNRITLFALFARLFVCISLVKRLFQFVRKAPSFSRVCSDNKVISLAYTRRGSGNFEPHNCDEISFRLFSQYSCCTIALYIVSKSCIQAVYWIKCSSLIINYTFCTMFNQLRPFGKHNIRPTSFINSRYVMIAAFQFVRLLMAHIAERWFTADEHYRLLLNSLEVFFPWKLL